MVMKSERIRAVKREDMRRYDVEESSKRKKYKGLTEVSISYFRLFLDPYRIFILSFHLL